MGKRSRIREIPLRARAAASYIDLITTGGTRFTHLPWGFSDGRDSHTWVLCALGCERAYQLRDAKWVLDLPGEYPADISAPRDGSWYCAYFPDCDNDAVIGAWGWNELLKRGWHGPSVPIRGVRYPLYPA